MADRRTESNPAVVDTVDGPWRLPAETEVHEATMMCWPVRRELWGSHLEAAERDYAEIARVIAR